MGISLPRQAGGFVRTSSAVALSQSQLQKGDGGHHGNHKLLFNNA